MNKAQRIIVSIVGITIILLTLLGITYAYYLTRIEGNTNTNSISITTADLKLQYAEGEDSNIDLSNIMPGTEAVKTFSVINKGNVAIDNYGVYLINVINQLSRTEDLTMSLECVSKNTETGEVSGTCTGFDVREFPKLSGMIINNGIASGITHEYELTVKYKYEEAIDQSIDMGKVIEAKVQIYNEEDVADITGSITGYSEGYTVEMHSDVKVSQIVDGEYKIAAAEPGTHELIIKDKDEIIKSRQKIVISKGESAGMGEASIDVEGTPTTVPKITITNQSKKVTLNLDVSGTNIQYNYSSSTNYDATQQGTLVNAIFTNTKANKNGTIYSETPLTTPGISISGYKYYTDHLVVSEYSAFAGTYLSISTTYQNYYFTYGTGYSIDEITGNITLTGVSTCKYSDPDCYGEKLLNSYVVSSTVSSIASETDTQKGVTGSVIYKLTTAPAPSSSSVNAYYTRYNAEPYTTEATLSKTTEDEGVTYYFRGGPKDNYVSFNNMCWRIVRIDKDGGVKLILASDSGTCDVEGALSINSGFVNGNTPLTGAYGGEQIISTNSDGTTSNVTYPNFIDSPYYKTNSAYYKLNNWFDSKGFDITKLKNKESTDWCLGDLTSGYSASGVLQTNSTKTIRSIAEVKEMNLIYDSYRRLKGKGISITPTLSCPDNYEKFNSYIGLITADEYVYAGGKMDTTSKIFLSDNIYTNDWLTLSMFAYYPNSYGFYPITIGFGNYGFGSVEGETWLGYRTLNGGLGQGYCGVGCSGTPGIRPVIVLKPDTFITGGDGTQTNPYVVS